MLIPERTLDNALRPAADEVLVESERGYPIAGVYGFGRGLFRRGSILGYETSYQRLNRLVGGRLVMSRLKAFEGALAVIPPQFDGWYLSPEFPTFEIDTTQADERYIANLCAWPEFWSRLRNQSKGVGARKERVTSDRLLAVKVPLPELNEQRRISAKLDSAIESMGQITIHRRNVESLRRRILHSYLRDLPRRPLSDGLAIRTKEVPVRPAESYNICGVYSFGRGLIRRPAIKGDETAYKRLTSLQSGLVVMSKLNAWEGALAVVSENFADCYVSPEYPTFEVDESVGDESYLNHLVKWPELWERLTPRGSMVRRKRTHPQRLLEIEVPFPDLDEQRRIAGVLDRIEEAAKLASHQETVLGALRRSLLNAAFSGQL